MGIRLLTSLVGMTIAIAALVFYYTSSTAPLFEPPKSILAEGSAWSTESVLDKREYQPVLDEAYNELGRRYKNVRELRWWAKCVGYVGLALVSVVTLIMGSYGIQSATSPDKLQEAINEQKLSKGLTRLVGLLIALSTLPGAISQRLETDATELAASGRDLWSQVAAVEQKLVDRNATVPEVQALVSRVREATIRSW